MTRARLAALVAEHPDRLAVADARRSLSYAGLQAEIEALLPRLPERGLVVSLLPSGPSATVAHLACLAAGAVYLPLPPTAPSRELGRVFERLPPDLVLHDGSRHDGLDQALGARRPARLVVDADGWREETAGDGAARVATDGLPADLAMIQLTSGSTGVPKAILLGRANIEASLAQGADFLERYRGRAVFSPIPQFHAKGGAVVLEHVLHGSSVLTSMRFLPGDDLKRMRRAHVALIAAAPSYFRMVLRLGLLGRLDRLTGVLIGSAACDQALLERLREARPELAIHLRYGQSEAFGALTRLDLEPDQPLPPVGLVGPPLPEVELCPLPDPGAEEPAELRVRSPSVALGQIVEPGRWTPLTDAEGWLATGDMGYRDTAGLHLRGRRSSFLKRHGYRIDPSELEHALVAHPRVSEAVVVGLPDPLAGEQIVAVVEGAVCPESLRGHVEARLSAPKRPQRILVWSALPRTRAGKPDRARIRATLE
jgi:acyl-CoA synthetase (AMP-forming)/AMP-acid ligase II